MGYNVRPSEIRYSQDTISSKFSDGTPLTSTFARLISGEEKVTDLPEIKCIRRNGQWYCGSRGNRRLYLYKKLEEAGVLSSITVLESYGSGSYGSGSYGSGSYGSGSYGSGSYGSGSYGSGSYGSGSYGSGSYGSGGRNFTTTGSGLDVRCSDPQLEDQIQDIISKWKRGENVVAKRGTARYRDLDSDSNDDYPYRGWDPDRYDTCY